MALVTSRTSLSQGSSLAVANAIWATGTGILADDASGPGCTVINMMEDPTAGGSLTSEQAAQLTDLHDEAMGKWVVDEVGNTLTLYKADGVTVLKQFNLIAAVGEVPAYVSRTPV